VVPRAPVGPPFDELTDAKWVKSWESTFLAFVRLSRAVLPVMRRQHWGRIVHLGGLAGRQPGRQFEAGSAIHASLLNLAKSMADSYGADNVLVTTVTPDSFATYLDPAAALALPEVPLGRYGLPRELAETVAFLCSERASYITGLAPKSSLIAGARAAFEADRQ
jgi:3-oxoacyl-[acyl-carrier protein] reductase